MDEGLIFFPDANEKQIRKLLAVKYPGTETQPKKPNAVKKWKQKKAQKTA